MKMEELNKEIQININKPKNPFEMMETKKVEDENYKFSERIEELKKRNDEL